MDNLVQRMFDLFYCKNCEATETKIVLFAPYREVVCLNCGLYERRNNYVPKTEK